jgi:hypothetical protein
MLTPRIFNPRTMESALVSIRLTKAGTPNKTDLRSLVGRWKIPLRYVYFGMREANVVPEGGWPEAYVWDGDPPNLSPLFDGMSGLRASLLERGFKDEW